MNGSEWKEHRRFTLQMLRDLGFGKGSMEDRIVDEISYLTQHIDNSEGHPVDIHNLLIPSMSNNICQLVFGHRYDFDEPKRRILDGMLDLGPVILSQIGLFATAPVWLSKTLLNIGFLSKKHQINTVDKLFQYVNLFNYIYDENSN